MSYTLHYGDCLDLMRDVPSASVDLIAADLPYGTTNCAWDSVIPFAALWEQFERLITPRGVIVLTASQPFTSALAMSNPSWFKYALVWEKACATGFWDAKLRPLKAHEDVLIFAPGGVSNGTRGVRATYNPQMRVGAAYTVKRGGTEVSLSASTGRSIRTDTVNAGTRYPRSVMQFANETGFHPTQKPVALFEYLIRTYSNEGDTVLDCCAGSGTTGVAAINTGRRAILMEQDAQYVEVSRARCDAALSSLPLFAAD